MELVCLVTGLALLLVVVVAGEVELVLRCQSPVTSPLCPVGCSSVPRFSGFLLFGRVLAYSKNRISFFNN